MAADATENQLGISWHDSVWIPILNPTNVLEYFSQRTNPFYDRTCNNEVVKMQRLDPSALQTMSGIEYEVIHVQDPILFVIRKQHRHSATQVTPISDYYILAGIVYQAPDLCSVINSRMLSALHNFESAFTEAVSYSRYHPSKGYWWQFKDSQKKTDSKGTTEASSNQTSSLFQREGVNQLLEELAKQFPPNVVKGCMLKKVAEKHKVFKAPTAVSSATATVQVKKEPEEVNTDSETKDSIITDQNLQNSDVNGLANSSSTTSKANTSGPVTGQKRSSDSSSKQPPQKKKK